MGLSLPERKSFEMDLVHFIITGAIICWISLCSLGLGKINAFNIVPQVLLFNFRRF